MVTVTTVTGLREIPDSRVRGWGRAEGNGKMAVRYLKKIFYFFEAKHHVHIVNIDTHSPM